MATLIRKRMGRRGGERRCDGACHNATQPQCNCVCGGRYHGVGSTATAVGMIAADYARYGREFANAPDEIKAIFDGARVAGSVHLEAARAWRQEQPS